MNLLGVVRKERKKKMGEINFKQGVDGRGIFSFSFLSRRNFVLSFIMVSLNYRTDETILSLVILQFQKD